MLPAAQGADAAEFGVVDDHVAAVALAEDGAFHMGRLQLAPAAAI